MVYLASNNPSKRLLILVSGITNYFYDAVGKRFVKPFQDLGWLVTFQTVPNYQPAEYDLTLLVNISDIIGAYAKFHNLHPTSFSHAVEFVRQVARRTAKVGVLLMEPAHSYWFSYACRWCCEAGVKTLYDVGFHDQRQAASEALSGLEYHFLKSGLNQAERDTLKKWMFNGRNRPIPWSFIGVHSEARAIFARQLVKEYAPNGFLYLPEMTHVTRNGKHLDGVRLQRVLEASRFYIWVSQDAYLYVESERFRNAAMSGCVPVKVQMHRHVLPQDLPFTYLMLSAEEFADVLHRTDWFELRKRFIADYLKLPSLESEIARVILSQERLTA